MTIKPDMLRGHTDAILLYHLTQGNSYGYEINKTIQEKTDNQYELKEATLYTSFRRLEESGYISSYWGDEQSGARRRYYTITTSGREYYKDLLSEWDYSAKIINRLIGGKVND